MMNFIKVISVGEFPYIKRKEIYINKLKINAVYDIPKEVDSESYCVIRTNNGSFSVLGSSFDIVSLIGTIDDFSNHSSIKSKI
jgi:hypothetical protein